ncbi:hypothetical protein AAB992_38655 [Burkholderia contaminans]|uniref:DUF7668 domain-containing protein n=1 Tax=Burkholderia contaminans TaxID=488447 RepID=UPI002415C3FA|nr:hypothetical protein [Burkholderia contaminans]WFN12466.1 hypothetical protein LXE92_29780 [Burkholderia contaminans]
MTEQDMENAVKRVVSLLVHGDFDTLERMGMLAPGSKEDYVWALQNYLKGRQVLTDPPATAFDELDIYQTAQSNRQRVDFDLWTDRGRSDLTAQIYVEEMPDGAIHPTLYDLRVL